MTEGEKKCADCCGDGSCHESEELSGSADSAEIKKDHTHKVCCDGQGDHCCSEE